MLKRIKKNRLWPGPLSMRSFHVFCMSAWVFFKYSSFFPCPKDMHGRSTSLYKLSQSECVLVGVSGPAVEGHPVQGGFPPGALSCWAKFQPPVTLN